MPLVIYVIVFNMDTANIKVLIVEDDEIGQAAAKIALEKLGHVVDMAEYGKDAVKLFTDNKYDLVFMDIAILDMDGFTITENFRRIEKEKKYTKIPIIALSGFDDPSFKKRAAEVGINSYILKPITSAKCKQIIDEFVKL